MTIHRQRGGGLRPFGFFMLTVVLVVFSAALLLKRPAPAAGGYLPVELAYIGGQPARAFVLAPVRTLAECRAQIAAVGAQLRQPPAVEGLTVTGGCLALPAMPAAAPTPVRHAPARRPSTSV